MDTKSSYSPTYKNLKLNCSGSPKEIKDKMRKDYKTKIQNNRNMLLNKFRSLVTEIDLHKTFSEIYNDTFNFTELLSKEILDADKLEMLEEIKNELIHDEVDWWLKEYEKSQMDNIDWSSLQDEQNVICPICQKNNLNLKTNVLTCSICKISITVQNTLSEIKNIIYDCVGKHSNLCTSDGHFTVVPDENNSHIYFMCDMCGEMNFVF